MKFKKHIIQLCALLLVLSWGISVLAGEIELYTKIAKKKILLGKLSDEYRKPKSKDPGKVSEDGKYIEINFHDKNVPLRDNMASSTILRGVRPITIIEVFDDPNCSKEQDWARITVHKLKKEIEIDSLEKSTGGENDPYEITFHNEGDSSKDLDGKVSAIKIPLLSYAATGPSSNAISEKLRKENPGLAIFLDAERIVANIKDTAYSHETNVDDDAGRYLLDCSGLLDYILGKSLPLTEHYEGMLALAKNKEHGPLAGTIYDYLSGGSHEGWKKINYLRQAKPGDVIVEKYDDTPGSGSTGHVMIVAGWMEKLGEKKCKGKTCWEYRVPVIESARGSLEYDSRDSGFYNVWPATSTRYIGKNETGVGKGFLYFRVNQKGEIICHQRNIHKKDSLDCKGSYVISRAVPMPTN